MKKELKTKVEKELLNREVNEDELKIIDLCGDIILRYYRDNNDLEVDYNKLKVQLKNCRIETDSLKEDLFNLKNKIKNER